MIKAAFHEQWWRSSKVIRVNADGSKTLVAKNKGECGTSNCSANEYSLMQYNFALFFGIAVQMYEATLVSDDTPWDRFRRQHATASDPALNPWNNLDPDHISRLALFGAHLFNDRTRGATNIRCSNCHEQAELTDASARRVADLGTMRNRDGNIIDRGFNNIGVRPTADDLGVGATRRVRPAVAHPARLPWRFPADFRRARGARDERLRSRRRLQDPVVAERRADCALFSQR